MGAFPIGMLATVGADCCIKGALSTPAARLVLSRGSAGAQDPPERISYVLGAWREPRLDHDSLDIHFGDDGRVEQVSVVKCKNLVR